MKVSSKGDSSVIECFNADFEDSGSASFDEILSAKDLRHHSPIKRNMSKKSLKILTKVPTTVKDGIQALN
jgi:hypothetical protein